jgi:hypothetical protein
MRSMVPKHKKKSNQQLNDATRAVRRLQAQLSGLQAQRSGLMIKVTSGTRTPDSDMILIEFTQRNAARFSSQAAKIHGQTVVQCMPVSATVAGFAAGP